VSTVSFQRLIVTLKEFVCADEPWSFGEVTVIRSCYFSMFDSWKVVDMDTRKGADGSVEWPIHEIINFTLASLVDNASRQSYFDKFSEACSFDFGCMPATNSISYADLLLSSLFLTFFDSFYNKSNFNLNTSGWQSAMSNVGKTIEILHSRRPNEEQRLIGMLCKFIYMAVNKLILMAKFNGVESDCSTQILLLLWTLANALLNLINKTLLSKFPLSSMNTYLIAVLKKFGVLFTILLYPTVQRLLQCSDLLMLPVVGTLQALSLLVSSLQGRIVGSQLSKEESELYESLYSLNIFVTAKLFDAKLHPIHEKCVQCIINMVYFKAATVSHSELIFGHSDEKLGKLTHCFIQHCASWILSFNSQDSGAELSVMINFALCAHDSYSCLISIVVYILQQAILNDNKSRAQMLSQHDLNSTVVRSHRVLYATLLTLGFDDCDRSRAQLALQREFESTLSLYNGTLCPFTVDFMVLEQTTVSGLITRLHELSVVCKLRGCSEPTTCSVSLEMVDELMKVVTSVLQYPLDNIQGTCLASILTALRMQIPSLLHALQLDGNVIGQVRFA
jgi:hypothetical protein